MTPVIHLQPEIDHDSGVDGQGSVERDENYELSKMSYRIGEFYFVGFLSPNK
jgi:hypothetical protein